MIIVLFFVWKDDRLDKKLQYFYSQPLVAFLILNNIKIEKVDKHHQTGRTMFFVENTPKLEEIIQKWKLDQQFNNYYKAFKEVRKLMIGL